MCRHYSEIKILEQAIKKKVYKNERKNLSCRWHRIFGYHVLKNSLQKNINFIHYLKINH
jgi:hypothetical protein